MSAQTASVSIWEIAPLVDIAISSGVDAGAVLQNRVSHSQIAISDYFRLQRDIALASDDLTAQFSDRKLTFRTGHFVVSQLQQAASLLSAMETLVEYFNMMHGEAYNSLRFGTNHVSLVVDDHAFPYRFRNNPELVRLVGDCLLIKIHALLDSLSAGAAELALKRVRLQRERGDTLRSQNRFWRAPIEHGCPVYELVYDYDIACRPLRIQDEVDLSTDGLFSRVIGYLEQRERRTDMRSVRDRAADLIQSDMVSQADVARKLDMSVATLRRRLKEEGCSFRDMLQESRLRRAESMLRRGCSISHVAEQLNYSDIRAFNRAFKRRNGYTPAAFARTVPHGD